MTASYDPKRTQRHGTDKPRPVIYRSGERTGIAGATVDFATRLLHAEDQRRVYRHGPPSRHRFPAGSGRPLSLGMVHYGIMIPDLPDPHRILANLILIGYSGFQAWDDDAVLRSNARHTVTVAHGTAATTGDPLLVLNRNDTELRPEKGVLRFGDNYEITIDYPHFRLRSALNGIEADIELTATGDVSWVASSRMYWRLTYLCRHTGTVRAGANTTAVSGLGSWEYGSGYLPYMELPRPLPARLKLPIDFFTYHLITLDAESQLMFVAVGAFGDQPAGVAAERRSIGKGSHRYGAPSGSRFSSSPRNPPGTTIDPGCPSHSGSAGRSRVPNTVRSTSRARWSPPGCMRRWDTSRHSTGPVASTGATAPPAATSNTATDDRERTARSPALAAEPPRWTGRRLSAADADDFLPKPGWAILVRLSSFPGTWTWQAG
ncbi:MAG TPA: DUF6670 family protein [Mycobacterium sp.]|nr:DUF6670 family protein [Mycobacterium sp.]